MAIDLADGSHALVLKIGKVALFTRSVLVGVIRQSCNLQVALALVLLWWVHRLNTIIFVFFTGYRLSDKVVLQKLLGATLV